MDRESKEDSLKKQATDEEILALAKKELLRDVKCASLRAEQFGAHSWAKPQSYVPSKRFLRHLLVSASSDNDRRQHQTERRKEHARRSYDSRDARYYSEPDPKEKQESKRKREKDLYSKEKKSDQVLNARKRETEKAGFSEDRKRTKREY